MKKLIVGYILLAMFLTACAPPTPATNEQPSIIIEQPTQGTSEMSPAQIAALTHLSKTLNLPADQITLVSTEAVTWPDGCLGVQQMGIMCTQALVDGFKIIFEADGQEYELHTNTTGSAVALAGGLDIKDTVGSVLITQLSENLGLDADTVSVVSNSPAEFSDTCLGVAMRDVMCAEVITPGRIVVLEADGVQYEYHVSDDGTRIQPATLALTWKREGGIAGFCDGLTVFLSGEVYGNQCKSQPNGTMGVFADLLSAGEMDQFNEWINDYGSVTLDASDPKGVADGMSNVVVLFGYGSGKPGKPVESEIFAWAQELFQKLYN